MFYRLTSLKRSLLKWEIKTYNFTLILYKTAWYKNMLRLWQTTSITTQKGQKNLLQWQLHATGIRLNQSRFSFLLHFSFKDMWNKMCNDKSIPWVLYKVTILQFLSWMMLWIRLCNTCICECPYKPSLFFLFIMSKCWMKNVILFAVFCNNTISETKSHIFLSAEKNMIITY